MGTNPGNLALYWSEVLVILSCTIILLHKKWYIKHTSEICCQTCLSTVNLQYKDNPSLAFTLIHTVNIALQSGALYAHRGNFDLLAFSDPKNDPSDPKINRDLSPATMNVCTKFQVDSCNTFEGILRKLNLTFVTSVTLTSRSWPQTNRAPQGPLGKLHTKFQFHDCNTF